MERVTGIEPALLAWKARALPLSYTRLLISKDNNAKTPKKSSPKKLFSLTLAEMNWYTARRAAKSLGRITAALNDFDEALSFFGSCIPP